MKKSLKQNNKTLFVLFILFTNFSFAQVGIGTTTPEAALDVSTTNAGLLIPRGSLTSLSDVTTFTNPQGGNPVVSTLIYNNGSGGVTTPGFYYWDSTNWIMLTTRPSSDWTIFGNTGTNPSTNFIGTADAQDVVFRRNNVESIRIEEEKTTALEQITIRDTNTTSGDIIVDISDNNTNGGTIDVYLNNTVNHSINANTTTVFNEQGVNINFRVESDINENAMLVDAANNAVIFGSTGNLSLDNTTFSTTQLAPIDAYDTDIDYVADFDNGVSRGTTMGLGSIEFLVDGEAELFISDTFSPTQHLTSDLGFANEWRDLYVGGVWTSTINGFAARSTTASKPMKYGLNEIMQLTTIAYKLAEDPFQENRIGLIGNEVKGLIKEATKTETYQKNEKGEFVLKQLDNTKVSYTTLVPVLIKATQEQQEIIKTLETRVNEQQRIISAFEARLKKLEDKN